VEILLFVPVEDQVELEITLTSGVSVEVVTLGVNTCRVSCVVRQLSGDVHNTIVFDDPTIVLFACEHMIPVRIDHVPFAGAWGASICSGLYGRGGAPRAMQ